jgi:hypothetical protein
MATVAITHANAPSSHPIALFLILRLTPYPTLKSASTSGPATRPRRNTTNGSGPGE